MILAVDVRYMDTHAAVDGVSFRSWELLYATAVGMVIDINYF